MSATNIFTVLILKIIIIVYTYLNNKHICYTRNFITTIITPKRIIKHWFYHSVLVMKKYRNIANSVAISLQLHRKIHPYLQFILF